MVGVFVPWNSKELSNNPEAIRGRHRKARKRLGQGKPANSFSCVGWIDDGSGCHIWMGSRSSYGYGQVRTPDGRLRPAHVARYEREIGPVPDGLELDHFACDNGAGGCCNPFHVRPVTHRENMLRSDSIAALALARTHCPQGHQLSGDNLSPWQFRNGGYRKCRTCITDRQNARRLSDVIAHNARKRELYAANPTHQREASHAYYHANKGRINAATRARHARKRQQQDSAAP